MDFKKGLDHYQLKLKPWFSSNIFKIYKGIRLKPTTLTNLINCIPIYSNSSPLLDLKPPDKQKTFSLFTMKSKDCLISEFSVDEITTNTINVINKNKYFKKKKF